ncbi:MAG: UDP-N-acetylmuramoyl-tripeptide--D-alanyl-D-alanine ligase [bacterium]|nr:UDP-N-acetylmuramoyl-tripeptide--D-alanyl-D-alanine ligase [Candidatus Jorgensenbacteria bacterium]
MKKILLKILQLNLKFLARATLARYSPGIVGITGSVGKTSTKEAVRTVLASERTVRAPAKNFNNELGLPLAILGDWETTGGVFFWLKVLLVSTWRLIIKSSDYPEILILEYAVDKPGDMRYLLEIARPHIGIFTAMGEIPVHVEFFTGPEAIMREKSRLISQLPATGFAILNADDELVMEAKSQTRSQVMTFGFDEKADLRISNFTNNFDGKSGGIACKLTYGGSVVPVRIDRALGKAQAYSIGAAAVTGLIFGLNLVKIAEALSAYEAPAGRLKLIRGVRESFLIDDTYNAAPTAMHSALDTLKSLNAKRKIAVLGDMLEIGKYTLEVHEGVGKSLKKLGVDMLITVGIRGKLIAEAAIRGGLSEKVVFTFMDVNEAATFLESEIQKGDLILVKASQGVRLEKLVKEVMAEPTRAKELLTRQDDEWVKRLGMYESSE